ncbi:MAG: hypothetical protein Q8N56_01990 [bacterium]|nr:hypothetical protein [bacterium]
MSSMPAKAWKKMGFKKAMNVLKATGKKVPAYRNFLRENNFNPDDKTTYTPENFFKLPVMDKKNYILKYPFKDLCFDLDEIYTIERSSGYSNLVVFWPRLPEEDALFPSYIEYAFVQFYGIDKKRTLAITTLALGTWVSGEKMAQALRMTAVKKKYKLTVISPGTNLEDTLEAVKNLSQNFDQTIIVGYPPFIKTVIDEGERQGIDWKKVNLKIGLGGEGYSEAYRETMAKKIGLDEKNLLGISGGYGAADLGMTIGREYPITVAIRKLADKDKKLCQLLFKSQTVPSLLQYNPSTCFIEEKNGELLFTIKAGIPVIRYNIHDRGGVAEFDEMIKSLEQGGYNIIKELNKYGYSKKDIWQLPFFYIFGRSDGTISVSGMNLYPENIEAALNNRETSMVNSFKIREEITSDQGEKFCIALELKTGITPPAGNDLETEKKRYQKIFLDKILTVNKDFKYVYDARPEQMKPVIEIHAFGEGPFAQDKGKIKRSYIER